MLRSQRPSLLWQPHFPHQLRKAWVGTQGGQQEVSLQTHQPTVSLLISGIQPPERLIFVSQIGIETCDVIRREVAILTLCLTDLDRFGESTLPACRMKSLLHARSETIFASVAGKPAVRLPFFDNLRVHILTPISIG